MHYALALLIMAALPQEWAGVADVTPAGLAKSERNRCVESDCSARFADARWRLSEAWVRVTGQYRDILLNAIRSNTDESGTDWAAAADAYTAAFKVEKARENNIIALHNMGMNRRATTTTVTTECATYRGVYTSTTRCTTTSD